MAETPPFNKFTIDQSNFGQSSFEFEVKYHQHGEVHCFGISPLSVYNLCDLLETFSLDFVSVFDVEQFALTDSRSNRFLEFLELIKDSAAKYRVIDPSTIVLSKKELLPLLSSIMVHNEFNMFDVSQTWDEEQIISQVIACRNHDWKGKFPVLPSLIYSQSFIYCHDDKFLSIDTFNPFFLKQVLARGLFVYAGYFLPSPLKLSEIKRELIELIWHDGFSLLAGAQGIKFQNEILTIGVSNKDLDRKWGDEYLVDFAIEYDISNKKWDIKNH